jgi:hypothetical protein
VAHEETDVAVQPQRTQQRRQVRPGGRSDAADQMRRGVVQDVAGVQVSAGGGGHRLGGLPDVVVLLERKPGRTGVADPVPRPGARRDAVHARTEAALHGLESREALAVEVFERTGLLLAHGLVVGRAGDLALGGAPRAGGEVAAAAVARDAGQQAGVGYLRLGLERLEAAAGGALLHHVVHQLGLLHHPHEGRSVAHPSRRIMPSEHRTDQRRHRGWVHVRRGREQVVVGRERRRGRHIGYAVRARYVRSDRRLVNPQN